MKKITQIALEGESPILLISNKLATNLTAPPSAGYCPNVYTEPLLTYVDVVCSKSRGLAMMTLSISVKLVSRQTAPQRLIAVKI